MECIDRITCGGGGGNSISIRNDNKGSFRVPTSDSQRNRGMFALGSPADYYSRKVSLEAKKLPNTGSFCFELIEKISRYVRIHIHSAAQLTVSASKWKIRIAMVASSSKINLLK